MTIVYSHFIVHKIVLSINVLDSELSNENFDSTMKMCVCVHDNLLK